MVDLTYEELDLKETGVKDILDDPAVQYLKQKSIQAVLTRTYDYFAFQIEIDTPRINIIKNAIYATAAWHCYIIYGQSISHQLELQDIGSFKANVEHYKMMAEQFASLLNVDLSRTSDPVLNDEITFFSSGGSMIDVK